MRGPGDVQKFYQANGGAWWDSSADRAGAQDVTEVLQEAFARAPARWNMLSGYDLPWARARRMALRIAAGRGRRMRGRTLLSAMAGIVTVAAAAAVLVIAHASLPVTPPLAAPVSSARQLSGLAEAPAYYVELGPGSSPAVVRRTATGGIAAMVRPPRGSAFLSVAAAADGPAFVLAAQTPSAVRFYAMRLSRAGQPGPLRLISVPPLPGGLRGCDAQFAGLAVTPDGRTLAISMLSNCASGDAGPSEIETASLPSGTVLATFHPGQGYPLSLSWAADGALAYDWDGPQPGVWLIPGAASPRPPSPTAQLLIHGSAGIGRYRGEQYPVITPDGSAVIATLGQGTSLEVAEFSARTGRPLRVLIPAASNPAQYCGLLWTSPSGQHLLAACGDGAEASIDEGRLTYLPAPWQLPSYPVPGGPRIAW